MNYELRITNYEMMFVKILCVLTVFGGTCFAVRAQSTNQAFPTAVTSNEISGAIRARDLGDARLTNYFYVFNGNQGDVFINVVASNFNGNIDVFTADGLRPLTKIVVFADASSNETGRVIYLRKPEKLILRVEGRTPNDDAATFKIKFAGSFQALSENEQSDAPAEPKVASGADPDIRVNSVGTIIEVKPKATTQPKETIAETKSTEKSVEREIKTEESKKDVSPDVVQQISVETPPEKSVIAETKTKNKDERNIEISETGNKIEVSVTDNSSSPAQTKQAESVERTDSSVAEGEKTETAKSETLKSEETAITPKTKGKPRVSARVAARNARNAKAAELNAALENIRLIVVMKDGAKIEKPMSEILRVGVDKGVLTVIAKDGTISRYSILDVARMTIE